MPDFFDELTRFAAEVPDPRVTAVAKQAAAPLRVGVYGRRGVGRRTVARALSCAGVTVTSRHDGDVAVYVVAEVVKPEDTEALAAAAGLAATPTFLPRPVLVVLNKADLTGGADVAEISARIEAPVRPVSGLFATAALDNRLDDSLWRALHVLATEPADLSCPDRFLAGPHRVPRPVRVRLREVLDLSGITRVLGTVRQGGTIVDTRGLLRRLSGVDAVVDQLAAVAAAVHYRRLLDAVAQLEALAVGFGRVDDFLSSDETVAARIAVAAGVVEAAGLHLDDPDDPADDPAGYLRRAVRWQRYSEGPVTAMHSACGIDIARASLRLWARAGAAG